MISPKLCEYLMMKSTNTRATMEICRLVNLWKCNYVKKFNSTLICLVKFIFMKVEVILQQSILISSRPPQNNLIVTLVCFCWMELKKTQKVNYGSLILFMATSTFTSNFQMVYGAGGDFTGTFVCMTQGPPKRTVLWKMTSYSRFVCS